MNRIFLAAVIACVPLILPVSKMTEVKAVAESVQTEAEFLGVDQYGAEETNRENMDHFSYRFRVGEEERILSLDPGPADENGLYSYPLQNQLKVGYRYALSLNGETVTAVHELCGEAGQEDPDKINRNGYDELPEEERQERSGEDISESLPQGTPGERTVMNFLRTVLMPVGQTLYVFGGGWNWQDDGAGPQARSIGVSKDWTRFFAGHDASYTFRDKDNDEKNRDPSNSYYPYGGFNQYYYAGLDCSGFAGWAVYNTLETVSGKKGYVVSASRFSAHMEELGFGEQTGGDVDAGELLRGDIVSMSGHVWSCLGTCLDGSIVIAHSTTSLSRLGQPGGGVQISAVGYSKDCEAYHLADSYMRRFYPDWSARYEAVLRDPAVYLAAGKEGSGRFTWKNAGLTDPEGLRRMSAGDVLKILFQERTPGCS